MNIQKRDLIALLLIYFILQLTLFDDYYESNMKASVQFLFYSEFTSSPQPCRYIKQKCDFGRRTDTPIRSARPLFLLEELLMVIPSAQNTVPFRLNYNNDVQLRIVDISPWKVLKNREQITHPFYAERLDFLSLKSKIGLPIENDNIADGDDSEKQRLIRIPLKLSASPFIRTGRKEASNHRKYESMKGSRKSPEIANIHGHRFIISIWNDGSIALHKIEAPFYSQKSTKNTNKQQTKLEENNRLIWINHDAIVDVSFANSSSTFLEHFHLSAVDAIFHLKKNQAKKVNKEDKKYDIVLIHATIESADAEIIQTVRISMYLENGTILWSHTNDNKKSGSNKNQASSVDCFQQHKTYVMDKKNNIFPHSFWNKDEDSIIHLAKFQDTHRSDKFTNKELQSDVDNDNFFKPVINHIGLQKNTQLMQTNQFSLDEDANVIINHDQDGIKVFSLNSGDPVCHLTLKSVGYIYADLNQDGSLDHIHIPSIDILNRNHNSKNNSESSKDKQLENYGEYSRDQSCSITAYSGVPAKKDLFHSNSLCDDNELKGTTYSKAWNKWKDTHGLSYSSAPPLITQNYDKAVTDVFLAFHHGEIMKFEVAAASPNSNDNHGNMLTSDNAFAWKSSTQKTPKWNPNQAGQGASYITSLPASNGKAILVSGEKGMSVLSYSSGRVLTNIIFPQKSTVRRPIVRHIDYHGVDRYFPEEVIKNEDIILVFSTDGVWVYAVSFDTSLDFWSFFAVCLCMTTIALLLQKIFVNRDNFGNHRCMSWDPW